MTGLHVAEPQPLWLSLQHTPPSLEISDTPADAAVGAAGILVEVAAALVEVVDALVVIADSAVVLVELAELAGLLYLLLHLSPFQFPFMRKNLDTCRCLNNNVTVKANE